MNADEVFGPKKNPEALALKLFFENRILPYLSEMEKENLTLLSDLVFGMEQLQEEYENFSKYDPANDRRRDFFGSVLVPFYMISHSEYGSLFKDMDVAVIEKAKALAEVLYKEAFFRNTYDSFVAWESCSMYKQHQKLLKGLGVLPEGAEERVAKMSQELDELWSRPEVERAFENAQADDYVASGMHEKSMLVQMFRDEPSPILEAEYGGYHELRPDLFPAKYEDYLQQLEDHKHPYRLQL